jgi:drug/metabolite transporter (DMT)-like permease
VANPRDRAVSAQIATAALLFGLVPLLVKSSTLSDIQLAVGRVAIAGVLLAGWRLAQRSRRASLYRCWRAAPLRYSALGALHGTTILSSFYAIKTINAAVAATLLYAGAVYLVPLSLLVLRERVEAGALTSLLVSLLGVGVLCGHDLSEAGRANLGTISGALSGLSMGAVFLLAKVLARTEERLTMATMQQLVALPLLLPLVLLQPDGLPRLDQLPLLLALGTLCTALPFVLLFGAMRQASGQRVGVLLLLELATPIVLGPPLLGEVPSLHEGLGGGLICVGCTLAALLRGRGDRR